MFASLFEKYDRLVLFDTETTGLIYSRDEIIEFAAVVVEPVDGEPKITREYDELVSLSPGGFVPPKIQQLTGISTQDLREKGLSKARVCRDIAELMAGNTYRTEEDGYDYIDIEFDEEETLLTRPIDPHPFVPSDEGLVLRRLGLLG